MTTLESDRPGGRIRPARRRAAPLRRGGRRSAGRPAPRLPGVLVRLAPPDPGAGRGRLPRRRAGHARLQPLVAPRGRRRLRHRPAGGRRPRPDPRARSRTRLPGRPRLGGRVRLGDGDEPPGGGGAAGDPQRPPSRAGCCAPCGDLASSPGPGTCSSSSFRGCRSASSGHAAGRRFAARSTTRGRGPSRRRTSRTTSRRGRSRAPRRRCSTTTGRPSARRRRVRERSGAVQAPTLVIWGERDRHVGPELAEPDPADVPNLERVERLPDASHWVQHDEPERVGQLLIEFFAGGAEREPAA